MTTFLLMRHGHTEWIGRAIAGHTQGVGLSDVGRQQAERLADRVRHLSIAALYSSPLQRTMETAEPLARALGLTIEQRPRLIEVDFGEWTGMTMTDLERDPRWSKFNAFRSTFRAPGGDLMLDVQSRMVDEIEDLRLKHAGQTVALVSHQDSIKAALAHYMAIPLDLFHRFEIGPASVSALQVADWGPRILSINNTGEI